MRERERRQDERQHHRGALRDDERRAAVERVGDVAADRAEDEGRDLSREADEAEEQRRVR